MRDALESKKDFFISRAGKNSAIAQWVASVLEQEGGYTCIIQDRDFKIGAMFPASMEEAFLGARRTIALLSPDYLNSAYCLDEWRVAYAYHRHAEDDTLLVPIRVAPGPVPPLAEALSYFNLATVAEEERAQRLLSVINGVVKGGKTLSDSLTPETKPLANDAFATPHFMGRGGEIEKLHTALWGEGGAAALTQPAAILGLGGVGKSAIAKQYARVHLHRYLGAWLVGAEHPATMWRDLARMGRALNRQLENIADEELAGREGLREAQAQARQQGRPMLIVFDNIETPSILPEEAKAEGLHIILTTRYATLPSGLSGVEIEALPEPAAAALLAEASTRTPSGDLNALARAVGGLPLALVQAGAYLRENPSETVAAYHARLEQRLAQSADDAPKDYPRTAAETVRMAVEAIEPKAPGARALLERAAFMAPDSILALLIGVDSEAQDDTLQKAFDALTRYSLWRRDDVDETSPAVSVHRVVQTVVRAQLTPERRKEVTTDVQKLLRTYYPARGLESWWLAEVVTPHALAADSLIADEDATQDLAGLLNQMSIYLQDRGAPLNQIEALQRRGLHIAEAITGADSEVTALLAMNLGVTLKTLSRYDEAEVLLRRALQIRESMGASDMALTSQRNNLAKLLEAQGRTEEAAEMMISNAATLEKEALAKGGHPNYGTAVANVALVLQTLGRPEEAEAWFRRAVKIEEDYRRDTPDHPVLSQTLSHYGEFLRTQGRYAEAEESLRRALKIDETIQADARGKPIAHPDIARDLNILGLVMLRRGDPHQAVSLLRRSLAIDEQTLPPDHPDLATCVGNLAGAVEETGALEDAYELRRRAADLQLRRGRSSSALGQIVAAVRVLRKMHRDDETAELIDLALNLPAVENAEFYASRGELLRNDERLDEAERDFLLAMRLGDLQNATAGELAVRLNNLGLVYSAQGRDAEALASMKRAAAFALTAWPDGDPSRTQIEVNVLELQDRERLPEGDFSFDRTPIPAARRIPKPAPARAARPWPMRAALMIGSILLYGVIGFLLAAWALGARL